MFCVFCLLCRVIFVCFWWVSEFPSRLKIHSPPKAKVYIFLSCVDKTNEPTFPGSTSRLTRVSSSSLPSSCCNRRTQCGGWSFCLLKLPVYFCRTERVQHILISVFNPCTNSSQSCSMITLQAWPQQENQARTSQSYDPRYLRLHVSSMLLLLFYPLC